MKATLLLLLIFSVEFIALAESNNEYTIEIASFTNLDSAIELANRVSIKVATSVTVERLGNSYVVRAGSADVKENLVPYLNILRGSGFKDAVIVSMYQSERSVVLEIHSDRMVTTPEKKQNSNVMTLNQDQHSSNVRSVSPNRESIEQSSGSDVVSERRSGQTNLMDVSRKEQPGTGRVTSYEHVTDVLSYDEARRYLEGGWRGYKAGLYSEAINYFEEAGKNIDTLSEARLGLAYCYIKLDKKANAAALLEAIVGQNYRISETLPSLISLLIEMKDYDKANLYISGLSEDKKEIWRKKIEERKKQLPQKSYISLQFEKVKNAGDIEALLGFANRYGNILDRCNDPWIFYNTAEVLSKNDKHEDARKIYYGLLSACADDWDLRIAAFYGLKPLSEYTRMRQLVDDEMKRANLPLKYREQLSSLKLNVLKEQLSRVPDNTPDTGELAHEILAIDPQDPDALLREAWVYYNAKDYSKGYEIFSDLHIRYSTNNDYVQGLIYSLIGLGEEERALRSLKEFGVKREEKNKIETQIYLSMGSRFYKQKNYAESEKSLKKTLEIDPQNTNARTLLAWTLYNQGKYDSALNLFKSVYEKEKEAKIAEAILNSYDKLGKQRDAFVFSYEAGSSGDDSLHEVSGSYFSSHNMPIIAAQINSDPGAPYNNADKMYAEFQPWFSHRTGESGISELSIFSFPFRLSQPFKWGNDIRFSFTTQWLYSGATPSSPFVGTAPLGCLQMRRLINSVWVFTPEISFEKEGDIKLNLDVGTTPLNGPVFPLPTFVLELKQDRWRLSIHQDPVTESILSYVGLEDPYGGREWGRLLRTGLEAEINLLPSSHYWLSVITGYDYYWGDNVKGNNALNGTISTGRTFTRENFDFSIGLFFTTKHFERNSNFFTFGNGGYFSPDVFLMTGPTVGIKTKPYKSYYLNAEAAIGYLYFRTENSPFLPLGGSDSVGEFKGESTSRIGYNFKIETLKLLTPHTALGVSGGMNQSADFTEWYAGLTLRYYISSRNAFVSSVSNKSW